MRYVLFLASTTLAFSLAQASSDIFTNRSGKQYKGKISAVFGPAVLISSKATTALVPIEQLIEEDAQRVADFLASERPTAPVWADSKSAVSQATKGRLQKIVDGKLVDYSPSGPEPDFYLVYFSAHWCGPCRRFTPTLVEQYTALKNSELGEKFELIFVSSDHDAASQKKYMLEAQMPWPALKYSQLGKARVIERWAGNGIPCLVVLSREGDVLYHSYQGDEYLGPETPLNSFTALLQLTDPKHPTNRKARHVVELRTWISKAGTADAAPQVYLLAFDRGKYPVAKSISFNATLELDERGRVVEVVSCGDLSSDIAYQVRRDAENWLFLPAVKGGKPTATRVVIPITI